MATDTNSDNSTNVDILEVLRNHLDKASTMNEVMNIRNLLNNLPASSMNSPKNSSVPEDVPLTPLAPSQNEPIENPGGIDWNNIIGTILNKEKNKGLGQVNKSKSTIKKVGRVALAPMGMGGLLPETPEDSHPLAQYLNQFKRTYGKLGAKVAGVPITKETQAIDALNKLMPGGIYQNGRGLEKWAGYGRFETPYGRMYIDQNGTLTKEPTEHAGAIKTI